MERNRHEEVARVVRRLQPVPTPRGSPRRWDPSEGQGRSGALEAAGGGRPARERAGGEAAPLYRDAENRRRRPRTAVIGMVTASPLSRIAASAPRMAGWPGKAMPIAARAGPALRTAVTPPMVVRRGREPVASAAPRPKESSANRAPA